MVVALKLMLIFSLMFGASAGTVSAAQGSVPGDPLYGVKLAWEQAQLNMAATPEAKLERLLTMAQTRLQEAQKLAEKGQDVPTALVQRYQLHVQQAERLVAGSDAAVRQQLMDRLQTRLQEHEQLMTQLQQRVQDRAQSQTALQQMLKTQEQVRERLQQQWEDGTPGQQGSGNGGAQQGGTGGGQQGPAGPGPNPSATPQGPQGPNQGGGQQGPNPTATCTPQAPGDGSGQQGPGGPGPNPTSTPQGPNGPNPNPGSGGSGSGKP